MTLEPGVTCVVGPNGSGKSNITDAVLWVLGEQSAKSLRGQAMEDVIFSGSSARQAVGVAEVDLVLDNSDGFLPIEFSEITLTRRMYRSGESEYLINQSPTRLMDILDLLHDTGLGREAHSVISQGRLAEVLDARPEVRRALIEEAAGVLKHKKRKERALRKLKNLDGHLARAGDIAAEIDRQLRPLQRQAGKAVKHSEISKELRDIEVALAVDDLRVLQDEYQQATKEEREADAACDIARYEQGEREKELEKLTTLLEEKGLFVGDIGEQRRRTQAIVERLEAGRLLLDEKGKNLVTRFSELRQTMHAAQKRIGQAREIRDSLSSQRAEADAKLEELYTQLGEARRNSETARRVRSEADAQLQTLVTELRTSRAAVDDSIERKLQSDQALSSLVTQRDLLAERTDGLQQEATALRDTLAGRRARFDSLEADWTISQRERTLASADVDKRVRVIEHNRRDAEAAREALFAARAELQALEEVERAFEAASPTLTNLANLTKKPTGYVGPVVDHLRLKAESKLDESFVELLLGSDVYGVFVEDWQAAIALRDALTKGTAQADLSIIPLQSAARTETADASSKTKQPAQKTPKSGTPLLDELAMEERFQPAVRSLLGDVYLVKSLQDAIAASERYPGFRFAARDGSIVWPQGKLVLTPPGDAAGGGIDGKIAESVLARKRREAELRDAMQSLDAAVAAAEGEVAAAEDALKLAQSDALDLNQKGAAIAGEHDSLRAEIGRLEEQIAKQDREQRDCERKLKGIEREIAVHEPRLIELDQLREKSEQRLAELSEEQEQAAAKRETLFMEEMAATKVTNDCNVDIATTSERINQLKTRLTQISGEVEQLELTITTSEQLELALELLRERLTPLHEDFTTLAARAQHWEIMLRDRASLEQADSATLRQTITDAREKVREATQVTELRQEALMQVRVTKGQCEIKVNQAVRSVVEEHGTPLEMALSLPAIEDRHATEDRAFDLRKRLSKLGSVNPIAHEEYEVLKSRSDFTHGQIADLKAAAQALNKVVAAIDRKMKERFLATFEEVDRHFQDVFAILFPGGRAQLLLTDPDNPEVTGVDFYVQPRGKRLKKMSLLSGGEQALTALALLFGLARSRPCPFYVLDEVEAALDDTNLRRFIAFINTMRADTQFLIVTHQRRTMEMADTLYGVSMQADGVSKLVSQRLEQALESVKT
ncbi:MAG: chromosome segregation protein SMC [Coriobacteriia bacterium]|nr:chromosome segregation protein SMC [Coriobacteriia bacterium]